VVCFTQKNEGGQLEEVKMVERSNQHIYQIRNKEACTALVEIPSGKNPPTTVRGSNPGRGEILRSCPDRPWGPPSLLYNGCRVFPGGRKRPGRDADPPSLLVPRSKKQSRAILVLFLRDFVACKKGETYLQNPPAVSILVKVEVLLNLILEVSSSNHDWDTCSMV
jgi:hypothetical protein